MYTFSASSPSWEVMPGDLGMCSEVLGSCNLLFCSEDVWGNMSCLLWVFLMLRSDIW